MNNQLFYGDNLEVLRNKIKEESIDLCYIDPPFNSKRNYNQIYTNKGSEDKAQAQAFIDTWTWNDLAKIELEQIISNYESRFTIKIIKLIKGFHEILGEGSLLSYLVSMTLRIVEIHRVLKSTGSFYLHCDPTVSHYLKIVLDAIFCDQGGDFLNEITWKRNFTKKGSQYKMLRYANNSDIIFFYSKSNKYFFQTPKIKSEDTKELEKKYNKIDEKGRRYKSEPIELPAMMARANLRYEYKGYLPAYGWMMSKEKLEELDKQGKLFFTKNRKPRRKNFLEDYTGSEVDNIWIDIMPLGQKQSEAIGYPTQKPEALLERIIKASSNEGDVILDAYCGCGTTIAVAQKLNRKWIGIDITYQSIGIILRRIEQNFGKEIVEQLILDGIPRDMASAIALSQKKDDRLRKEFEKWALLTYSHNYAIINEKKGADRGIDGIAYFLKSETEQETIIFQVKSGKIQPRDIRDLYGTITREKAAIGIFITLNEPTSQILKEAQDAGYYYHELMKRSYEKIQIVTIEDLIELNKRLDVPLTIEVLKSSQNHVSNHNQLNLDV